MGEVDRIRSLFTPSEWRRHKRSLRVYEGYLGFQYMGKETDGESSVNTSGCAATVLVWSSKSWNNSVAGWRRVAWSFITCGSVKK
jgi:hypothetical protein